MEQHDSRAPPDLTHSLWEAARLVHSPDALLMPGDIIQHLETANISHGVYGLWFDPDLEIVPRDGCNQNDGKHLLYVGIAQPGRRKGRSPAGNRLWRNHLRGTVRVSTLRLSLAALMADRLGLAFFRDARGRVRMAKSDEDKLSTWLGLHAAITVAQHDDPWSLERLLITSGPSLPLNLEGSTHPFRQTLSILRRSLGRREPDSSPNPEAQRLRRRASTLLGASSADEDTPGSATMR
jgi:hypothetical protein